MLCGQRDATTKTIIMLLEAHIRPIHSSFIVKKKNIFFLYMSTRLLHWNCSRMEWNEMNFEFGVKNENFPFSWFNLLQKKVRKTFEKRWKHRKMKFTIIIRIFLLNSKCACIYAWWWWRGKRWDVHENFMFCTSWETV